MIAGLSTEHCAMILEEIQKISGIMEVKIFGSRAQGNFKPGSDIDLALFGENLSQTDGTLLSSRLNEYTLLPYKFDVVVFGNITSTELKQHIIAVGKTIFSR
ncbi:MAG: nucleotidyltransferase domain-containing protein [Bacteroidota bacterium]